MLQAAAVEQGMAVSGDGRISEANAAELMQIECETLAKRRKRERGRQLQGAARRRQAVLQVGRLGSVDRGTQGRFLAPFPHQAR